MSHLEFEHLPLVGYMGSIGALLVIVSPSLLGRASFRWAISLSLALAALASTCFESQHPTYPVHHEGLAGRYFTLHRGLGPRLLYREAMVVERTTVLMDGGTADHLHRTRSSSPRNLEAVGLYAHWPARGRQLRPELVHGRLVRRSAWPKAGRKAPRAPPRRPSFASGRRGPQLPPLRLRPHGPGHRRPHPFHGWGRNVPPQPARDACPPPSPPPPFPPRRPRPERHLRAPLPHHLRHLPRPPYPNLHQARALPSPLDIRHRREQRAEDVVRAPRANVDRIRRALRVGVVPRVDGDRVRGQEGEVGTGRGAPCRPHPRHSLCGRCRDGRTLPGVERGMDRLWGETDQSSLRLQEIVQRENACRDLSWRKTHFRRVVGRGLTDAQISSQRVDAPLLCSPHALGGPVTLPFAPSEREPARVSYPCALPAPTRLPPDCAPRQSSLAPHPPTPPSLAMNNGGNFHRLNEGGLAPSPQLADQQQGVSFPNPNVQGHAYIYLAVYSSVPVYEMMVRGIGVMRRRSDSYLNATQILKVAGVDKGKRTKILEKDIALGIHEKVQGGYGRYQGTWIPFERAVELAREFGVSHLLAPIFEYTPAPPPVSLGASASASASTSAAPAPAPRPSTSSGKDLECQSAATILTKAREQGLLPEPGALAAESSRKRGRESLAPEDGKRVKLEAPNGVNGSGVNGFNGTANGSASTSDAVFDRKLRRSTKAGGPPPDDTSSIVEDPLRLERHKTALKNIFSIDADNEAAVPDLSQALPPDIDPDTAIDDNDHTALHWAAALARIPIVQALVNVGADMFRGNNVGETPLIRAVLVTNNSDQDAFPRLLQVLGPSLRTVDDAGRSVLHHAALVAGVKGRASSARYYMESVLEYVARHEKGQFKELVDAQDSHGDTALNIAARVGNRGLVRILIDVGADKMKPNKLGLRPGDFGVESADLSVSPAEDIVATLRSNPAPITAPARASEEVLTSLMSMIASLSTEFASALSAKTTTLDETRTQLRSATRDLAAQRKEIALWRTKVAEVDERQQRVRNLERALEEEDQFDWTGRTEVDGTPARPEAGPAFEYRGPGSTLSNLPSGIAIEFDADPPPPSSDTDPNSLAYLVRLQAWHARVMGLLRQRIERLEGGNAEQELRLQKIVAHCCGVEPERIEGMLDGLLVALESDGSTLDMVRVAGFLQRVKDRSLAA